VKGFNHLIAATLAADPIVEGGRRVVFLSSDDEDRIAPLAALAVNRRDELTPPQSVISIVYRADRHSDPAPNDTRAGPIEAS
jgi:hypothetical protein